jgi:hypothetical protein
MSRIRELYKIIKQTNLAFYGWQEAKLTMEDYLIFKSYVDGDLEFIRLCMKDIYKYCKRNFEQDKKNKMIIYYEGLYYYKDVSHLFNYETKHKKAKEHMIIRSIGHMLSNNKMDLESRVFFFYLLEKLIRYYYSLELSTLDFFKIPFYFDL